MTIKETWDIDGNCTVGEVLETIARYNVKVVAMVGNGPAGGNPMLTFEGLESDLDRMSQEVFK